MTLPAQGGMIELIDKGSPSDTHPTPLLFVHGGWHAAWCWDEHFLEFFAAAGYRAIALSLRGHGGSPTTKPLSNCSIADYRRRCAFGGGRPTRVASADRSLDGRFRRPEVPR